MSATDETTYLSVVLYTDEGRCGEELWFARSVLSVRRAV